MRVLIAVLLFLTPAFSQPKSDVDVKGMHGKVHTVLVQGKHGSGEFNLDADETFDPDGWLTEAKRYGLNNQLMEHDIFKRNGPRMIEHDVTRYLPADSAERLVTTFEEHGFPLQQVKYSLDGTVRERMQVIYEETQIRELHYDARDKLVSTRTISTLHDPDSPDRHIEQRVDGQPETVTDLHQEPGHLEVHQKEFKNGRVASEIIRDIHPSGTSTAIMNSGGSSSAASTRNAEFDEMIIPGGRVTSKFNALGQRIEEDRYDLSGKLSETTTFAYETDDHGNWTRRSAVSSGDPTNVVVTTRTFTYY